MEDLFLEQRSPLYNVFVLTPPLDIQWELDQTDVVPLVDLVLGERVLLTEFLTIDCQWFLPVLSRCKILFCTVPHISVFDNAVEPLSWLESLDVLDPEAFPTRAKVVQ